MDIKVNQVNKPMQVEQPVQQQRRAGASGKAYLADGRDYHAGE